MKRYVCLCLFIVSCLLSPSGEGAVLLVQVQGEIDGVQAAKLSRALESAETTGQEAVLLEIDTFGGQVDAAVRMRDRLLRSQVPVFCYVQPRAWSAGALIALACDRIYMAPGSSIGAAEPIPATEKNIAALKAEFAATAGQRNRNTQAAAAMVDKTMGYAPYAAPGQILALTSLQAKEAGVADALAGNRDEVLRLGGLAGSAVQQRQEQWQDGLAAFLAHPLVKSLLVAVLFLAVMTEIKTAGTGVAGMVGLGAAALLFGEPWLGGSGVGLEAWLFAGGVLCMLIELVVPGFGVFGVLGIAGILGAVFLALGGDGTAIGWMVVSLLIASGLFWWLVKKLPESPLGRRLILRDAETSAAGFMTQTVRQELLGKIGTVVTPLRLAGTVRLENEILDVVSSGEFLPAGCKVVVSQLRGATIVVRRYHDTEEK
nr:NfeD family protein [uncultured Anaeromusa sp.]